MKAHNGHLKKDGNTNRHKQNQINGL